MKDIRAKVHEKSCMGMRALAAIFQAMTADSRVECEDFRWGLLDFGI